MGVTSFSETGDLLVRMAPTMTKPPTISASGLPLFWLANCANPMAAGARDVLDLNRFRDAVFLHDGLHGAGGLVPAAAGIGRGDDGVIGHGRGGDGARKQAGKNEMLRRCSSASAGRVRRARPVGPFYDRGPHFSQNADGPPGARVRRPGDGFTTKPVMDLT